MWLLRRIGAYISMFIIDYAHVGRYWLALLRGEKGTQGARIIIVDDRRVILVSHWYAPWVWTLPGGGVGKNETPEETAIREAREETGFTIKSIAGMIGTYTGSMGKRDKVSVYYTGDFDGSLALTPNFEIMARSWFDIDNLPEEISPANRRRIEAYRNGVREEKGEW
ncbi:NUDIX domain-containing protein [Candidatus Kaiserbacteria bacterium]|nr:NUDIX domain-containing protein [Candidatus Kaiserbacteria bacterium]